MSSRLHRDAERGVFAAGCTAEGMQQAPAPGTQHGWVVRSPLLASAGVRHGFSTRLGGVSRAYLRFGPAAENQTGELNLGFTAADTRDNVVTNRARLLHEVFGRQLPLVTLGQVHSATIQRVGHADAGQGAALSGDGLLTREVGLALGIHTADCVPVLLADRRTGAMAAFHAGWRGTLARIVEQGVHRMGSDFGTRPEDLLAAIGPAIGPCCYRVGEEVAQLFRATFDHADELFRSFTENEQPPQLAGENTLPAEPRIYLNLPEANRRQLVNAGLPTKAVDLLPWCTCCRNDTFFSYRAEQGFTGRMLAVIANCS